jgi:AcrR family transcriptional regulator
LGPAENPSDGETRATLIAAARKLAQEGEFSLKRLYAESGVARADFYRCFANKQALLAAIVSDDAKALGAIAVAMEPQAEMRLARAGGASPVTPPSTPTPAPVDAWLERRLRVFERALAALETRQDQGERDTARNLALLEEKLQTVAVPSTETPRVTPQPVTREPAAAVEEPVKEETKPMHTIAAPALDLPVFEMPKEDPISESEIQDFIANARVAAQRATIVPEPAKGPALPRWIAWMGVVVVALLVCAGLALGNVAGISRSASAAGTAYRVQPQDALGRMMALADSGDARAQTLLAQTYLRGGSGIDRNDGAALRWSLAAAEQGQPVAQYLAGALTSKTDASRAASWFEQAALHGNIKAMHNLAIAYAEGLGVPEDDRRAAAWFNRAAQQGYVDSQFDLAVLFERGQGVAQNRVAALKWYLIAAKGGDRPSQSRGDQLRGQMPAGEIARAEQMAASYKPQPHDVAANAVGAL